MGHGAGLIGMRSTLIHVAMQQAVYYDFVAVRHKGDNNVRVGRTGRGGA